MTNTLRLCLFGAPILEKDGELVQFVRRKSFALLVYLALANETGSGGWHSRDSLAAIFWPDSDNQHARAALRRALADLNSSLSSNSAFPRIESQNDKLRLPVHPDGTARIDVDVVQFRQLLQEAAEHSHPVGECDHCQARLEEAVNLSRGDFMAGFKLADSPDFDEWQFFINEELRQELFSGLSHLIKMGIEKLRSHNGHPESQNKVVEKLTGYARRIGAMQSLDEEQNAMLIRAYVALGHPAAALRTFQEYSRRLKEEVGGTPSKSLQEFAEGVRIGSFRDPISTARQGLGTEGGFADQFSSRLQMDGQTIGSGFIESEIRPVSVLFVGLKTPIDLKSFQPARSLVDLAEKIAKRYDGYLERFIGQGFWMVFGLPYLHEDDPQRALLAAIEIMAQAERNALAVGIGATNGEIFQEGQASDFEGGAESEADRRLINSPTLVGAALTEVIPWFESANAGQILVAPNLQKLCADYFEFGSSESGKPLLIRPRSFYEREASRADQRPPLVGRDSEFELVKKAVLDLNQKKGGVVLITGEAGLGKSRILAELRQWTRENIQSVNAPIYDMSGLGERVNGICWLETQCLELDSSIPYAPFIGFLNHFLFQQAELIELQMNAGGNRVKLSPRQVLEQIVSQINLPNRAPPALLGFPQGIETLQREVIQVVMDDLLSLSEADQREKRVDPTSPEAHRRQIYSVIYNFVIGLARERPLVLVFDDLHFADALSQDLLAVLGEAIVWEPILLICTYRPPERRKGFSALRRLEATSGRRMGGRYKEIKLQELSKEESLLLARHVLADNHLPDHVEELLLEKLWGNPFFIEEVLQVLQEQGVLYRQGQAWHVRSDGVISRVPENVQSVVLSRVDRLPADMRFVLRLASVIGVRFSTELLKKLLPSHFSAETLIFELEEAGFVSQVKLMPGVEFAFKHSLIQESIYAMLGESTRQDLHGKVAEVIENQSVENLAEQADALAFHYQRSTHMQKAIEWKLRAAEKARQDYLNQQAMMAFRWSLEKLDSLDPSELPHEVQLRWRLAALTGLGQIQHGLRREAEAEEFLRQAIETGRRVRLDTAALVRLYYWLGEVLHWQGRYAEQLHLGEAGLSLLNVDEMTSIEAAMMNQTVAIAWLGRGEVARFKKLTQQTADFVRELNYSEELRPTYIHVILAMIMDQRIDEADDWLAVLQQLGEDVGDLRALAEIYDYRWGLSFSQGDIPGAQSWAMQIEDLALRLDDSFRIWRSKRDAAWLAINQNELELASEWARMAQAYALELESVAYQAETAVIQGIIFLIQGQFADAKTTFDYARTCSIQSGQGWTAWVALCGLAQVAHATGNVGEAIQYSLAVIDEFFPYHLPFGWWFNRWPVVLQALSILEKNSYDQLESIQERVVQLGRKFPAALLPLPPFAQRTEAPANGRTLLDTGFASNDLANWTWIDTYHTGELIKSTEPGIIIETKLGCDLWNLNKRAPRFVISIAEQNYSVQASFDTRGDWGNASGGLLLWENGTNYLRLVVGQRGSGEITFDGCVDGQNMIVGRYSARSPNGILRLELAAGVVRGLVATEKGGWVELGRIRLSECKFNQAGIMAIGAVDPLAYAGRWSERAFLRFDRFCLCEMSG